MSTEELLALVDAGDVDAVAALLAREPDAAAGRDEQGLSVAMHALYRGRELYDAVAAAAPPLDPFDRIVAGHTDGLPAPDARTPDGFTGLHIAAFSHNAAAARVLLDAGADPNVLAIASFAQVTPLGTAATFGANDVAAVLLAHGAAVDHTADHGYTPLHAAAQNGNAMLVELLLAHGADHEARNADGRTPADLAEPGAVQALLGQRLDVDLPCVRGCSRPSDSA
jgi:ankyrin repeat protein